MFEELLTELVTNCTECLDVIQDMDPGDILHLAADASGDINPDLVDVSGYFRADGTWVEPYVRTVADGSVANNLGTWGLQNA